MKRDTRQEWVDVHNDELMHEMIGRPTNVVPRDPSVWTKTPKEKKLLRNIRHSFNKYDNHFHSEPKKSIPVEGKLIIFLKKNNRFDKTTYSIKCFQHDIPEILAQYRVNNFKKKVSYSVISKYTWNGKTYKIGEYPYI